MKEIAKKFGALMRAHRKALGLSQTNVAKQLGISQQAYGRYENGDREPELGHSNLATTLNIYTHVFGDVTSSSRGIADKMDAVFEKEAQKGRTEELKKTAEA